MMNCLTTLRWCACVFALFVAANVVAASEPWEAGLPLNDSGAADFSPRFCDGVLPQAPDGRWVLALGQRATIYLTVNDGQLGQSLWQMEQTDTATVSYAIDGGDFVTTHNLCGAIAGGAPSTVSALLPKGSKVVVQVRLVTSSKNETHLLESVSAGEAKSGDQPKSEG